MKHSYSLFILLVLASCVTQKEEVEKSKYLRWVGDSEHNPEMDDDTFQLCYGEASVYQYFNFSQGMKYKGERPALWEAFKTKYKPVEVAQSGMIRIRFIVNCNGETGRFRMISSDENYKPSTFDTRITDQLLEITKSLDGWVQLPSLESPMDYYQYLIFKIVDGEIKEILP